MNHVKQVVDIPENLFNSDLTLSPCDDNLRLNDTNKLILPTHEQQDNSSASNLNKLSFCPLVS